MESSDESDVSGLDIQKVTLLTKTNAGVAGMAPWELTSALVSSMANWIAKCGGVETQIPTVHPEQELRVMQDAAQQHAAVCEAAIDSIGIGSVVQQNLVSTIQSQQ